MAGEHHAVEGLGHVAGKDRALHQRQPQRGHQSAAGLWLHSLRGESRKQQAGTGVELPAGKPNKLDGPEI